MILLDTHAVLWFVADDHRLSARAAREIAKADAIAVSSVSCWEIATLDRLGRIRLDRDAHIWSRDLYALDRVVEQPVTAEAATSAGGLPDSFPGDPADRFLYAQALELALPIVTKDTRITTYARAAGDVRVVW